MSASITTVPQYDVSLGRTLLGNWVEERQVAYIDNKPQTIKELHVGGHAGVLTHTKNTSSPVSTSADSYKKPENQTVCNVGRRRELMEKQLYETLSSEIHETAHAAPPSPDFASTTKTDYHRDFTPVEQKPTMEHDVNGEAAMTFWHQNINTIHGVTQVPHQLTPFKKNAAFSTPIHEYKDSPKPGEEWNY
ncbi:sperm-associated antigen 8-like isoform X2 [Hydractinia symbiolongicarpus]|nr:sperm-associated antigen 8-like isoform X2 [Hydractinia symbiolongicarpus]